MSFTYRRDLSRPLNSAEMDSNLERVETLHDAAEQARDVAVLNAPIYDDTTAGLAATSDGDYFSIPAAAAEDYLELYRNDAGSATLVKTYTINDVQESDFGGPTSAEVGKGAIVESGTNANGSYVRWENGEQMCWRNAALDDADVTVSSALIELQASTAGAFASGAVSLTVIDGLFYGFTDMSDYRGLTTTEDRGRNGQGTTPSIARVRIYRELTGTPAFDDASEGADHTANRPESHYIGYIAWGYWK